MIMMLLKMVHILINHFFLNIEFLFSIDAKSKEEPLLVVSTNNETNEQ